MMDYEIFKKIVEERFKDYLSEKYKDMDVQFHPVKKVNRILDGIILVGENQGKDISPTIYINDMYENYKEGNDLQAVLKSAAARMEWLKEGPLQVPQIKLEDAKDNIVFQLVNTEQNKEMLNDMPHRKFQDLSITYRWVVEMDVKGTQSIVIDNRMAKMLGFEEGQLYDIAKENTKRIFQPSVQSLSEVTRSIFIKDGMPEEMADLITRETSPEREMYVMSNDRNMYGAAILLYEDELHKLSERLGTNLFIMPSSIHEVIAISADEANPDKLAENVTEINMGQVILEERLSNQVYFYDKDLRQLSLATDTPNKRLDVMAEGYSETHESKQAR